MRLIQSTIERLLYVTLLLTFSLALIAAIAATLDYQKLARQQKEFHAQNVQAQEIIISTQKNYINCILGIVPVGTTKAQQLTSVHMQEKVCFNKSTPEIK